MRPYYRPLGVIALSALLAFVAAGVFGTAALLPFLLSGEYPHGLFLGVRYDAIVNIIGLAVWGIAGLLFVVLVTVFLRASPKSET